MGYCWDIVGSFIDFVASDLFIDLLADLAVLEAFLIIVFIEYIRSSVLCRKFFVNVVSKNRIKHLFQIVLLDAS